MAALGTGQYLAQARRLAVALDRIGASLILSSSTSGTVLEVMTESARRARS
jgi:hypothetical protein